MIKLKDLHWTLKVPVVIAWIGIVANILLIFLALLFAFV